LKNNFLKYRNVPVEIDGIRFASLAEGRRYGELKLMDKGGLIMGIQIHPEFLITATPQDNTQRAVTVGKYHADFKYWDVEHTKWVVEDVKGGNATRTEAYRLRKKIVEAIYGITIMEVQA